MVTSWLDPNIFAVCFAGIGGCAVGLLGLVAPKGPRRLGLVCAAGLLALCGFGVLAAVLGQPSGIWLLPLLAGVVGGLFAALRSPLAPTVGLWVLRRVSHPRLQAAAVLVFSLGFAIWWAHASVKATEAPDSPFALAGTRSPGPEIVPDASTTAATDRGRRVALYVSLNSSAADANLSQQELSLVQDWTYSLQLIRTGSPSSQSNCHGWVFTGGRFRIKNEDVSAILEDNGYLPVEKPQPQDLIIYSDGQGQISHTGIVCAATQDGQILIESKWGSMGRYIHPIAAQPYGSTHAFYRSPRTGHRLRGLGD